MSKIPQRTGYVMIALAALIWGSIGVIVRFLSLSALVLVEYRVLIALPFFLILWLRQGGTQDLRYTPPFKLLIASGLIQAAAWVAFFTAIKLTTVANAVVLLYTSPIFVAILAPYFLSERRQPKAYVSLLFASTGILLIFTNEGLGERLGPLGILSGLLSGILYAFLIMSDKKLSQNLPSQNIVTIQLFVASIVLAPSLLLEQRLPSLNEIGLLVILGLVQTGLALYLYIEGLRSTPAQHAVIIQYLEPTSAFFYAALILVEIPGLHSLLGGMLIIAANLILFFKINPNVMSN